MSLLRTTCPTCGQPQTLDPSAVVLHDATDGTARYVFTCSSCDVMASRAVASRSRDVMVAAGVTVTLAHRAPAAARRGRPLTLDDLLDLHELLATPTWFEQLLASLTS